MNVVPQRVLIHLVIFFKLGSIDPELLENLERGIKNKKLERGGLIRLEERSIMIWITIFEYVLAALILFVTYGHFQMQHAHSTQAQIVSIIHTVPFSPILIKFGDIGGFDDYWAWLMEVMLPRIFTEKDPGGNLFPEEDQHHLDMHYNKLYGGIMYWNIPRSTYDCLDVGFPPNFYPTCYSIDKDYNDEYFFDHNYIDGEKALEDFYEFQNLNTTIENLNLTSNFIFLPRSWGLENIKAVTEHIRDSQWLNRKTQRMTVGMIFYNSYSVTTAYIPVMFQAQGNVRQKEFTDTIMLGIYHRNYVYRLVFECIVLAGILFGFYMHTRRFCRQRSKHKYIILLDDRFRYTKSAFVVILIHQFGLLFQAGLWVYLNLELSKLNVPEEDTMTHQNYYELTLFLQNVFLLKRIYLAVVNINILFQCLILMKISQRFPVFDVFVAATKKALAELLLFLSFIFGILFFFAVSASVTFGGELYQFSTIVLSMESLIRFIGGDFNFEDMRIAAPPIYSSLFLFTFYILISFILLNMFIAIILESYSAIKSEQHLDEKFFETRVIFEVFFDTMAKYFGFRHGFSLSQLIDYLNLIDPKKRETYTYEVLKKLNKKNARTKDIYESNLFLIKLSLYEHGILENLNPKYLSSDSDDF